MYNVTILEASRELTPRERIKAKDKGNAKRLETLTRAESIIIEVVDYVVLKIESDKSEDPEYINYMIIDNDGTKYITGSESFWTAFMSIWDELNSEIDRENKVGIPIEIYQAPSKNREGKTYMSCSLW